MKRILSIDIFRGLTILVMVFVNDLAGVSNLPDWMYHMPADADAMSFVDVVFPAFLIIVGMSIPLAIDRRFKHGDSLWQVVQHVLVRSFSLVLLGVFMVNAEEMNGEENLIPESLWNILLYLSAVLIWNQYPNNNQQKQRIYFLLQLLGVGLLFFLAFTFRKGDPGNLTGMTHSWWGILGLIGWAYLISTVIYLFFQQRLVPLAGIFALLIIAVIGLRNPELPWPGFMGWIPGETGHLVHSSLVMAGIIMTLLLQKGTNDNSGNTQIKWILSLGIFCFVAGYFIRPFYGISKIYATPTWALYSIAGCCLVFVIVHWLVEVKGIKRWAGFLKPAGTNPLLTYILPYIFYAAVGFNYLPSVFTDGAAGFIKSVLFSLFILWISKLLTRLGVILKL